jgi:hypothetical protein
MSKDFSTATWGDCLWCGWKDFDWTNSPGTHGKSNIVKLLALFAALCSVALVSASCRETVHAQESIAYPPAIASWDEATKEQQRTAGEKLVQEIVAAARSKQKLFSIPKGDYRFGKSTQQGSRRVFIMLRDLNDIVIDGSGSTFWFEDAHQAVYIGRSRNVTIKNLFFDWDPLPYTQGRIVSVNPDNGTVDVRLDAGFEKVSPRLFNLRPDQNEPNVRSAVFDANGRFKRFQNGYRVMPFLSTAAQNGLYAVKIMTFYDRDMSSINAAVGDRIAFWIRGDGGFLIEGSENVTLEDITLYSCSGFGYRDSGGKGPITFRRCHIFPRPGTTRLLGGNSDAFHSQNMEIGPVIEECDIRSLGDDGVNVHGYFYNILAQESPTSLITTQIAYRGDLENVTLDFYRKGNYQALGRRTNVDVKSITWEGKPARRLLLKEPIEVEVGDMLSCDNFVGAGAIIRNNSFTNLWPRGILYRSHSGRIENNRFEWIGAHALALYPQPESWRESAYIHDLVVANNTVIDSSVFTGADGRDIPPAGIYINTPGYKLGTRQRNIELRENVVVRPGGDGIIARGVVGLRITGNRISEVGNLRPGKGITVEAVEELVQENNQIVETVAK